MVFAVDILNMQNWCVHLAGLRFSGELLVLQLKSELNTNQKSGPE